MSEQGEAVKLQEYATDKQIEFFDRLRSGDDTVHEEARTELVKLADQTLELLDSLDASKVESEPGVQRIRTRLAIIAGHQVEEFTLDVYEEGYDPSDDQLMADLTDGAKARITTEMLEAGKLYIFSAYYAADKRVPEGCDVEGAVRAMFDAPDSKEKRHFLRFVRNVTKDAVANKAAAAAGFYDIYALYAAAVNRPLAVLRHLLQLAVEEWEVLDRAPRIRLEREPEGRIVWLEPDEEARLLEASRASRTKHLARLLVTVGTGERPTAGRAPRANLGPSRLQPRRSAPGEHFASWFVRQALPAHGQARAGPGTSPHRDDDVPRDGHDVLAGEGGGGAGDAVNSATASSPIPTAVLYW